MKLHFGFSLDVANKDRQGPLHVFETDDDMLPWCGDRTDFFIDVVCPSGMDPLKIGSVYSKVPGEALPGMPWIESQPIGDTGRGIFPFMDRWFVLDDALICPQCRASEKATRAKAHGFMKD